MTTPFDNVVEIYDRIRPSYPDALFDELFAKLPERPAIVEIGPATGQATHSLLARGATVTAVEAGTKLASFLRTKFETVASLNVLNTKFEDAPLPAGTFDAVFAATSFHWVDPAVRLLKSHRLLRDGGLLAVVATNQIRSTVDRGYFDRSHAIYRRHLPDEKPPGELEGENVEPPELAEFRASGLFGDVRVSRYRWDQTYATADYADLMRSYSNMQEMQPAPREALIAELCAFIDAEFEGSVTRPLVITLTSAQKSQT